MYVYIYIYIYIYIHIHIYVCVCVCVIWQKKMALIQYSLTWLLCAISVAVVCNMTHNYNQWPVSSELIKL